MRVLIVGGTRFVGYALVWRLIAAGHSVTLFNRGTRPDPFGHRVERLSGDRTTDDFLRLTAGRQFDAAVDFAAYTAADVRSAIASLRDRVGHYIFISSGQVYLVRQSPPRPARESDYEGPLLPEPRDISDRANWEYGMGKRGAEDVLVDEYAASGFPSTRLRLPIVNGERDYSGRLESYLWRMLDGGPVLLPDGGSRQIRHVYSGAVAGAIADLLEVPPNFGDAYNLAQQETPTIAELVSSLADLLGAPARIVPVDEMTLRSTGLMPDAVSPFSGRWASFIDPSRARDNVGFRHEPLRQYLDKIVTSFLAHPPNQPPENYLQRDVEVELARSLPGPA